MQVLGAWNLCPDFAWQSGCPDELGILGRTLTPQWLVVVRKGEGKVLLIGPVD